LVTKKDVEAAAMILEQSRDNQHNSHESEGSSESKSTRAICSSNSTSYTTGVVSGVAAGNLSGLSTACVGVGGLSTSSVAAGGGCACEQISEFGSVVVLAALESGGLSKASRSASVGGSSQRSSSNTNVVGVEAVNPRSDISTTASGVTTSSVQSVVVSIALAGSEGRSARSLVVADSVGGLANFVDASQTRSASNNSVNTTRSAFFNRERSSAVSRRNSSAKTTDVADRFCAHGFRIGGVDINLSLGKELNPSVKAVSANRKRLAANTIVAEKTRGAVRASASSVLSQRNANRGSAVARVALGVGGASIARPSQVVTLAGNTGREETTTLRVIGAGGGKINFLAGGDSRVVFTWNASQNVSAVAAGGAR